MRIFFFWSLSKVQLAKQNLEIFKKKHTHTLGKNITRNEVQLKKKQKKLPKLYSFLQFLLKAALSLQCLTPLDSVDQPKLTQMIFSFAAQNFSPSPDHPALSHYGHQQSKGRLEVNWWIFFINRRPAGLIWPAV